jgi:hypothetical protein
MTTVLKLLLKKILMIPSHLRCYCESRYTNVTSSISIALSANTVRTPPSREFGFHVENFEKWYAEVKQEVRPMDPYRVLDTVRVHGSPILMGRTGFWFNRVEEDSSGLTFQEWTSDVDTSRSPVTVVVNYLPLVSSSRKCFLQYLRQLFTYAHEARHCEVLRV